MCLYLLSLLFIRAYNHALWCPKFAPAMPVSYFYNFYLFEFQCIGFVIFFALKSNPYSHRDCQNKFICVFHAQGSRSGLLLCRQGYQLLACLPNASAISRSRRVCPEICPGPACGAIAGTLADRHAGFIFLKFRGNTLIDKELFNQCRITRG